MRKTNLITKFILAMIFMLLLVSCKKKEEPIMFKLLDDDTYEVVAFNESMIDNNLIIPSTYDKKEVTSIGAAAFSGAKAVTSIFIPNTIATIKAEAFSGLELLDNVTFEQGSKLESIGNYGFYGALELKSINLPTSLEEIGSFAFGKTQLTTFNFPEKITHFPSSLFFEVETLETISISKNIESIHQDAFNGLINLKAIQVDSNNTSFSSKDDVLYNKNQTEIIKYPQAKLDLTFNIPSDVILIKEKAFKNAQFLTTISIPNSVTAIESYAFEGTKALTSITIPNSVTQLGESTFKESVNLDTVHLPNNLETIPYMTFYGATSLTTVYLPNNLKHIEDYAFSYTEELVFTTLPSQLKEIGDFAFYGAAKIKNLTIPQSVEMIGSAALSNMESLKTLVFEENSNLTVIGNKAFADNESLTSIVIPESVESMGLGALSGSNKLQSITIPFIGSSLEGKDYQAQFGFIFGTTQYDNSYDVVYIGSLTTKYYVPSSLKEVIILGGETIYSNAFDGISSVESLILPETLKTIQSYAFRNMNHLKSLVIPDSVETIAKGALFGTSRLESIIVPFLGESLNATKEKSQFGFIFGDDQFTSSYEIDYYEFNEDKKFYLPDTLKEVTVLSGEISSYAFSGAKEIEVLVIPNQLTTLGDYAFNEMNKLKHIDLPSTLQTMGKSLLKGAKALEDITIPENITVIEDGFLQNASSIEQLVIPEGITKIGKYAFDGVGITALDIPESVVEIDDYAFGNLSELVTITIPTTVTKLGQGVFNLASQLIIYVEANEKPNTWHANWNNSNRPVYFGVNEQNLFEEDGVLYVLVDDYLVATRFIGDQTEIIINDIDGKAVKEIGSFAFFGADEVLKIELPSSLTKIGTSAFNGANRLQVINIPIDVDSIGNNAFLGTNDLVTYVEAEAVGENWHNRWIPSGRPIHFNVGLSDIINIDNSYYIIKDEKAILTRHLGGFETITIPRVVNDKPVETISGSAFTNIRGLYSVYIPEDIVNVELAAFHNVEALIIYVEAEAISENWNSRWNFSNRPVYFNVKEANLIDDGHAQYILFEELQDTSTIQSLMLTRYYGNDATWTVPREVNGLEVKQIKKEAFSYLNELKSLYILNNIVSVESSILKDSTNIVVYIEHEFVPTSWANNWNDGSNIVYLNVAEEELITQDGAQYLHKNDQLTLTRYIGSAQNFTTPETINEIAVKNIGKEAFLNTNTLEYVIILDNIAKVDENAFDGELDLIAYIEFNNLPIAWSLRWNGAEITYHLGNAWELENGVPVLIED